MTKWMKIRTAAAHMDASEATVRRLIADGKLTPHTTPFGVRLDREEIDRIISPMRAAEAPGMVATAEDERRILRRGGECTR
jgi:excisionase family DNA binding protein